MKKFCMLLLLAATAFAARSQVTYERILESAREPQNWLTCTRAELPMDLTATTR